MISSLSGAELQKMTEGICLQGIDKTLRAKAAQALSRLDCICSLNRSALDRALSVLSGMTPVIPSWSSRINPLFPDQMDRTEAIVFFTLLNSLNFCFWPLPGKEKWGHPLPQGKADGAMALFLSMKRAWESCDWIDLLKELSARPSSIMETFFRGSGDLLFWDERLAMVSDAAALCLRELKTLTGVFESREPAREYITLLLTGAECFRDPFLKRAQLAWAMICGHLGICHESLSDLTLFADYKVPQTLQKMGILEYNDTFREKLARKDLIQARGSDDNDLRSLTIICGQELVKALNQSVGGSNPIWNGASLDYCLWSQAQLPATQALPYHLCLTTDY